MALLSFRRAPNGSSIGTKISFFNYTANTSASTGLRFSAVLTSSFTISAGAVGQQFQYTPMGSYESVASTYTFTGPSTLRMNRIVTAGGMDILFTNARFDGPLGVNAFFAENPLPPDSGVLTITMSNFDLASPGVVSISDAAYVSPF